ncbi:MAG: SDR family oxidoreductase [Thermoplasmata archaeon]|nr:SDR family oxidoreductase [Thermoplasmata archaeon]MCI4361789.1 SDR family oxidoreductase [Thermoplasmata archaeon]
MALPSRPTASNGPGDLRGRTAWVIGASRGIGADVARAFARRGAMVVVSARDADALGGVARELGALGVEALAVPADVSEEGSLVRAADEVRSRCGHLEMAVNNAGEGFLPTDLVDVTTEAFDRVLQVHVRGTFLAMKHEIPMLLAAGGGAIVNMSSTAGTSAYRGGSPYVAAKHAILGLTKSAALDYAARGVRVNAVAPGPIETDRLASAPEAYREQARQAVPMRRLGRGVDVAEAVVWLASPAAAFVTGTTLAVDGGRSAGWS